MVSSFKSCPPSEHISPCSMVVMFFSFTQQHVLSYFIFLRNSFFSDKEQDKNLDVFFSPFKSNFHQNINSFNHFLELNKKSIGLWSYKPCIMYCVYTLYINMHMIHAHACIYAPLKWYIHICTIVHIHTHLFRTTYFVQRAPCVKCM